MRPDLIAVIVVVAVLMGLLMSASRNAVRIGGRDVLAFSPLWRGLVRLIWFFPIGVMVAVVISPPNPGEGWIAVALIVVFGAISLPVTLEVFRREISLTASGISQQSAWSQPVTIPWKEVREVEVKQLANEVEVRSAKGKKVRVSLWLSGLDTFAEALEGRLAHLPAAVEAAKRVRAFRI